MQRVEVTSQVLHRGLQVTQDPFSKKNPVGQEVQLLAVPEQLAQFVLQLRQVVPLKNLVEVQLVHLLALSSQVRQVSLHFIQLVPAK